MKKHFLVGASLVLLSATVFAAGQCQLQPAATQRVGEDSDLIATQDPARAFLLRNGSEDGEHNWAWEGPVDVVDDHGKALCSLDIENFDAPLFIAQARYLYLPSVGAASYQLFVVDAQTCRIVWRSREAEWPNKVYPDHIDLGRRRVAIGADCLPAAPSAKAAAPARRR